MKRCLILTGGDLDMEFARDYLKDRVYDRIIAADAGLSRALLLKLRPDEVVGDLDTVSPEVVRAFREDPAVEFEVHRPEKDETDTELALMRAFREGLREADILGALGGRADHALANIFQMAWWYKKGFKGIRILDAQNCLRVLGPEEASREVFKKGNTFGKYISFIPLTEQVKGLTLTGFKYPLENADVPFGTTLTVSNELEGEEGRITFAEGLILAAESRDRAN